MHFCNDYRKSLRKSLSTISDICSDLYTDKIRVRSPLVYNTYVIITPVISFNFPQQLAFNILETVQAEISRVTA